MSRLRTVAACNESAVRGLYADKLPAPPASKERIHSAFYDGAIRSLERLESPTDYEQGLLAGYRACRNAYRSEYMPSAVGGS